MTGSSFVYANVTGSSFVYAKMMKLSWGGPRSRAEGRTRAASDGRELQRLRALDRVRMQPEVEVRLRDPRDDRARLPVEVKRQDRPLPSGRPRADPKGVLTQPIFVDEGDRFVLLA